MPARRTGGFVTTMGGDTEKGGKTGACSPEMCVKRGRMVNRKTDNRKKKRYRHGRNRWDEKKDCDGSEMATDREVYWREKGGGPGKVSSGWLLKVKNTGRRKGL